MVNIVEDWGINLSTVVCNHCDWNFLLPEGASRECPHCFEGELQAFDASSENLPSIAAPELLMPFQVDQSAIANAVSRFAQEIPYPPEDLNAEMLSSRAQQIFLPMWLVDAHVVATWQAELGYPYQVESHKSSYSGGQWYSQKVIETQLDWEKRLGQLERNYENVTAPALDKHQALMKALGGFPKRGSEPYKSSYLQRAYVRLPQRSTTDAFPDAQVNFKERAGEEVLQAAAGEKIRDFTWDANYSGHNWTLMLLPSYISYYTDDEQKKRLVFVNGQNAYISGEKRGSMLRARQRLLIGLALTAILVVGAIALVLLYPQYENYAAFAALVAVIIALGAFFPVIQVWRFNERQAQQG